MTAELTYLTLATLWLLVHFAAYAWAAGRQLGFGYTMGPRDTAQQLTGKAARLQRALNNHFEALSLFAIAALVITYSDQADTWTGLLSLTFLLSRILYLPAYYWGLTPWRTVIWFAGFLSTITILIMALL